MQINDWKAKAKMLRREVYALCLFVLTTAKTLICQASVILKYFTYSKRIDKVKSPIVSQAHIIGTSSG